ncbi:hypothetical protein AKJ16_DCAP08611 [Drosera capensis]
MIFSLIRLATEQTTSDSLHRKMFRRGRFLSFPLVIGATLIGVVSGKAIFGPPLEEYWKKKLQEEAKAKESDATPFVSLSSFMLENAALRMRNIQSTFLREGEIIH